MDLDIKTDYGKLVVKEFFSGEYDNMTIKEFRILMQEKNIMQFEQEEKREEQMNIYKCGHCGYVGPCYGTPIGGKRGLIVSTPWCYQCHMNDKLEIQEKEEAKNETIPF